ncbi:MAG: response regulator [Myxococcales bacterium]|nr:response regulator [Myxococcales bacterium]
MPRVLVVDDNVELAEDLVEILTGEGHQALAAFGGREALSRAAEYDYDAALVDIRMPDMDGVALVGRLMRERPDRSYFFMTGHSSDRSISEAMALSQGAVLEKPLDIDRMLRLIAAAGRHSARPST